MHTRRETESGPIRLVDPLWAKEDLDLFRLELFGPLTSSGPCAQLDLTEKLLHPNMIILGTRLAGADMTATLARLRA